ncbi:sentrin-specific protease 7 isoform X2 [Eleginops maclovinus]
MDPRLLDHKHADTDALEMARRQPCLILTDVLETEQGKAYMERIRLSQTSRNRRGVSSTVGESGRIKEKPLVGRDKSSSQKEANKNGSQTPKSKQKTTSSLSQRSKHWRRSQSLDDDKDTEENKDIEQMIIGKGNGDDFKYAGVVDCGFSVRWDPADDTGGSDEFSPASIKDRLSDPEKEAQNLLKRKREDPVSPCNGTSNPKCHRDSVLRLNGDEGKDGGLSPMSVWEKEPDEDEDLGSPDRTILQFMVGGDDQTQLLLPTPIPHLEAGDSVATLRRSLSSSQDNTATASLSEPIVLSSDDEEGADAARCSLAIQTLDSVEDAVIQSQSPQEAEDKEQEAYDLEDMQMLHVLVEEPCSLTIPTPSIDYSFSTLHCGGFRGRADGDIMIADHKIIIPLKDDDDGEVEVRVTVDRTDMRRYSVWEEPELVERDFHFEDGEEPFPAAILLLYVSETAAAAVKRDLQKLCINQHRATSTDKASPFLLLTLTHPLEGMEGALLRSLLEIDCINSLTKETFDCGSKSSCLDDFNSLVLSLDDSIELIRRTGLDSPLLFLLGLESSYPPVDTDEDDPHSDTDINTLPNLELVVDSQKETELKLETERDQESETELKLETERDQDSETELKLETEKDQDTETELKLETEKDQDTETELKPEEDRKEQELEQQPEKKEEEPARVYTLCHRRTKDSYQVSLCKPDSSWAKFKHRGLARRLIQFPPPPLKGGITVTMEDLQCLDTGIFLNDVIIDFYLKYLLENASAAVAERSHIFSSFFFRQLTRRDNASEGTTVTSDACQRQRRHQRVKTWTRHVDIFKKDFLFVPVNQEAHWYLVIICFPGLEEPKSETWSGPDSKKSQGGTGQQQEEEAAQGSKSPNDITETTPTLNHLDSVDTKTEKAEEKSTKDTRPGPVNCTEQTFQKETGMKRPCILIMDSLKLSLHERVYKLLREYLQSEWEVRRGSSRDFSTDQMQSSHCKVPLQDNSSDCGLYLLQYVESFLKDPVVHFDLPLQLQRWFPRQQVRRKRDEIRDLVLKLYREQNVDSNR